MKNTIRKVIALAMVLALILSMSAVAEKKTASKSFKLPEVKVRETEAPAETEAAEETEGPAETEAPAEQEPSGEEAPVETEAPAEEETKEEPAEPKAEETEAPAEETEPEAEEKVIGKAYVSLENADSSLNVRKAATTDSDRLGSLNHGDKVSVLGYDGDWTRIVFGSGAGYVKSSFLADEIEAEEPEVEEPAEPEVEEPTEPEVEEPTEPEVEETEEAPAEEPTEEPGEEEVLEESLPIYSGESEAAPEEEVTGEEAPVEEEAPAEIETTEEPAEETEPEASVEPEASEEPVEEAALVEGPATLGEADVRLEGDGLSEIFITLPEGTALTVLGVEGDWVKVEVDGQIGYIYKDSVQGVEFEEPEVKDPEAEPVKKVTIFSSRRSVMSPGETITLTSKLEGFEGLNIRYQWQCDKGAGFEDVPGADSDSYSFTADIETLSYDWRLAIYVRK